MYSKYPKYISYDNTGKDRDFNIYTEEFLGGADTYIYINGERCKDISAVQYSVREQQQPIYGYASRRYDDVASGIRIVKGVIKMPVRNTSYNEKLEDLSENLRSVTPANNPPSWVYNYSPQKESNAVLNKATQETYNIQSDLLNMGYSTMQTGIMDSKTKIAVLKYRKNSGDYINCNNESALWHCFVNKDTKLKIMPNETSVSICDLKSGEEALILNEINKYYLISTNNKQGYILKEEVNQC